MFRMYGISFTLFLMTTSKIQNTFTHVFINQELYENYVKGQTIDFIYTIHSERRIRIEKEDKCIEITCVKYEDVCEMVLDPSTKFMFVFEREKYVKDLKRKQNAEYKRMLEMNTQAHLDECENIFEDINSRIFEIQIKQGVNVFYIDTPDEFTDVIKDIGNGMEDSCSISVKKCASNSLNLLHSMLVECVGVSEEIARAISEKYKNLSNLVSNPYVCEISNVVVESKGNQKRFVGLTTAKQILLHISYQ